MVISLDSASCLSMDLTAFALDAIGSNAHESRTLAIAADFVKSSRGIMLSLIAMFFFALPRVLQAQNEKMENTLLENRGPKRSDSSLCALGAQLFPCCYNASRRARTHRNSVARADGLGANDEVFEEPCKSRVIVDNK